MIDLDPKYEEEVSGCTACIGIISKDKIYVVSTFDPNTRCLKGMLWGSS